MSDSPYLTAKELAPLIGLTAAGGDKTVRRWHNEGKFPAAICEGSILRFDLEEVRDALKARAKKAAKARP